MYDVRTPFLSNFGGIVATVKWNLWEGVRIYRLYDARGGIIVIVLGSGQALHPSTGLCYAKGTRPSLQSFDDYFSLLKITFIFDDNHRPLGFSPSCLSLIRRYINDTLFFILSKAS